MGTEFLPKDYLILLKEDIPNGTEDLIQTSKTLEDVADHCLLTYDRSLEQTVNYTAQALGSVAYKINLLATNFLEVLDKQNIKLNELQTKVNHLNMQVHIHQEKTARLSIGKYTMPRDPNAMRSSRNNEPISEIQGKYKRKEIDFTILDNVGHGVKEPQLGTSGVFSNTSRRSSTSGSDAHSSTHAYTQSNIGGSLGPKTGSEYINKFGKIQTIGRTTGININNPSTAIYRAPGALSQKSQIPMASPNLNSGNGMPPPQIPNYGNTVQYQQQMSQGGPRRSSSTSTSTSGSSQVQQQKQYQPSANVVSPHKMSVGSIQGNPTPYGYSGMNHPMACIPPPPPVVASQPEQNISPMMRYNELPPPPLEPPSPYQQQQQPQLQQQQQNTAILPPPPNVEQFQRPPSNEQINIDKNQNRYISDSVGIAHLQPTPYDVLRIKSQSDEVWAPSQYICKVVTLYKYLQNKEDELSFLENELIYVKQKNDDGRWEGVMNGKAGLFPGNYVENLD